MNPQVLLDIVEDVEPDAALQRSECQHPSIFGHGRHMTYGSVGSLTTAAADRLRRRSSLDGDSKSSKTDDGFGEHG